MVIHGCRARAPRRRRRAGPPRRPRGPRCAADPAGRPAAVAVHHAGHVRGGPGSGRVRTGTSAPVDGEPTAWRRALPGPAPDRDRARRGGHDHRGAGRRRRPGCRGGQAARPRHRRAAERASTGPSRTRWPRPVAGRHRRRGRHLVVQAGTGTGKSLAYPVPAGSRAARWWSPRPPRPSRTSWPTRTSRRWPRHRRRSPSGCSRVAELPVPPAGRRAGRGRPAGPGRRRPRHAAEGLVARSGASVGRRPTPATAPARLRARPPGLVQAQRRPPRMPRGLPLPLRGTCFAEGPSGAPRPT